MSTPGNRFLRGGLRGARELPEHLEEARVGIEALARSYGLDFFDTVFVMCTYEEINMVAAYGGFPTRYPHWRFGMDFLEMQKSYEFGLSKIYELVINTDPSYAYLMDCNLDVDQKLVMAHVYGHVDFFKNNLWFQHTNRKMLDQMANHATQVRRIIEREGASEVEAFIDQVLSLDNLIDPHLPFQVTLARLTEEQLEQAELDSHSVKKLPASRYMDPFVNPPEFLEAQRQRKAEALAKLRTFPEEPVRDVLGFLLQHAPLKRWQRDIVRIVRDEAYYFAPQGQTKIMNEGWASYWHTKLMTAHILTDAEVVDFADHNAGTMAMAPGQLNPYKLGVELWRHIEQRWDKGQFGKAWIDETDPRVREAWDTGAGLGRDKIFQVRKTHNDVTFLDEFLTPEFCAEQGFFTTRYDKKAGRWVMDSGEFAAIKAQLLEMVASRGTPRIAVVDANHANRGELRLQHTHDGLDLKLEWAAEVLGNLAGIWGRPVQLDTVLDDHPLLLRHDGEQLTRGTPENPP